MASSEVKQRLRVRTSPLAPGSNVLRRAPRRSAQRRCRCLPTIRPHGAGDQRRRLSWPSSGLGSRRLASIQSRSMRRISSICAAETMISGPVGGDNGQRAEDRGDIRRPVRGHAYRITSRNRARRRHRAPGAGFACRVSRGGRSQCWATRRAADARTRERGRDGRWNRRLDRRHRRHLGGGRPRRCRDGTHRRLPRHGAPVGAGFDVATEAGIEGVVGRIDDEIGAKRRHAPPQ